MESTSLIACAVGLEVSVRDVSEALKRGEPFRLIDCREQDEYALCRLPCSQLIPLSSFVDGIRKLQNPEECLVVYCHHGMRSMQATQYLRSKGFHNCFSMNGGIQAWSEEIDPAVPQY